ATSRRSLQACIASLSLQSSLMSKTYLKSDHFNGGGSVALAGFRKLDDLPSDRLTKWIGVVGGTERRQRYLECNAHKTDSLGVEALVVQVCPEGHEGTLNAEMFLNHKASSRKGFP